MIYKYIMNNINMDLESLFSGLRESNAGLYAVAFVHAAAQTVDSSFGTVVRNGHLWHYGTCVVYELLERVRRRDSDMYERAEG